MKTEKFSGTIESAYGSQLDTALKFEGTFEAYESVDEVRTGNDFPNNDEILAFVNNKRKANARQKSMTETLTAAGINKPTLDDPQVQLATIIKALIASGKSREDATKLAEATLGVKVA